MMMSMTNRQHVVKAIHPVSNSLQFKNPIYLIFELDFREGCTVCPNFLLISHRLVIWRISEMRELVYLHHQLSIIFNQHTTYTFAPSSKSLTSFVPRRCRFRKCVDFHLTKGN